MTRARKKGWCLYKLGCKGPITYNACATVKWNNGTSFPIEAGHGCIGCAEPDFWDKGGFYDALSVTHWGTSDRHRDRRGRRAGDRRRRRRAWRAKVGRRTSQPRRRSREYHDAARLRARPAVLLGLDDHD